jgi:hypothetical protein
MATAIWGDIVQYILPVASILGLALFLSFNRNGGFSRGVFLVTVAVGFAVIVWVGAFPPIALGLSALCLVALILGNGGDDVE